MAAAHPTPLSTVMAPVGQLSWQAPHSMHAVGWTSWTALPSGANTPCGHTAMHIPQLAHNSGSYLSVLVVYELNIIILAVAGLREGLLSTRCLSQATRPCRECRHRSHV